MNIKLAWKEIGFNGKVTVARFAYNNNVPALVVYDEEGEELVRASVNLPEFATALKPNQTFIKTWSENEGLLEALQEAGIVSAPKAWVPAGYSKAAVVDILV
jgi:hypothetical protein